MNNQRTALGLLIVVVTLLGAAPAVAQPAVVLRADKVTAPNTFTVSPVGDVIFAPGGKDIYPATSYDIGLGLLTAKFRDLWVAEAQFDVLVAREKVTTVNGRLLVGPGTLLTSDLGSGAGDTTITVKHNNLAVNGTILLEGVGKFEAMTVTGGPSGTGPYAYTVTRAAGGSRWAWNAGDGVFNTGTTGNGFIDCYADHGVKVATEYGPSCVGNVRTSNVWNAWAPRWAFGNLNGLYGKSTNVYGFAAGDSAKAWLTLNDTDGLVMKYGATPKLAIDPAGNASFAGTVTVGSGTTFESGYNPTTKIAAGGAAADINANVTAISGGKITTGSITAAQIAANTITADRMNVSSLSAINANLGTVTAGEIRGVTISGGTVYGGSGNEVILNSSGISIAPGANSVNQIKWGNAYVLGYSNKAVIGGSSGAAVCGGPGVDQNCVYMDGAWFSGQGKSTGDWTNITASGTVTGNSGSFSNIGSDGTWGATNSTWACGGVVHLSFKSGLFYDGYCSEPDPASWKGQNIQIAELRQRLAALEAGAVGVRAVRAVSTEDPQITAARAAVAEARQAVAEARQVVEAASKEVARLRRALKACDLRQVAPEGETK